MTDPDAAAVEAAKTRLVEIDAELAEADAWRDALHQEAERLWIAILASDDPAVLNRGNRRSGSRRTYD
jgi:hypothetical protein